VATVCVWGPLKQLAGGGSEHRIDGSTVREILEGLEHDYPGLTGWVLDERRTIRRHLNVYVNGERGAESTAVGSEDRVEVLPAITGGI
jgi:molybdopterin synthase sulfur carrier subunit